ncbi:MAG: hypothetical protein ACUZ8I_03110 [Candidatus Scalindua sp.]
MNRFTDLNIIKEWGSFARQKALDTLSADRQGHEKSRKKQILTQRALPGLENAEDEKEKIKI